MSDAKYVFDPEGVPDGPTIQELNFTIEGGDIDLNKKIAAYLRSPEGVERRRAMVRKAMDDLWLHGKTTFDDGTTMRALE